MTDAQKAVARWFFDAGFTQGFHDGCNRLDRHDHAFAAWLCVIDDESWWPTDAQPAGARRLNQADAHV